MSLINDALNRAKQAQQQNPFGGQPVVPLQPVDYSSRPNYLLRALVALLAVVTLACSVWFFWKWWSSQGERRSVLTVNDTKADPTAQSSGRPQSFPRKSVIHVSTNIVVRPNVAVAPKPGTEVRSAPTNASITTSPTVADASAAAAEPAPPPFPFADLKLRSIIYREGRPAAVINGDMLYVGDEISGARVVRIDRHTVTVERKGETNELRLPRL